ncbi:hypothetical protein PR202_ga26644 [Eleusine coracana subsp. coracana]|uniref:Uncharacterized protein n=1 Tax=Eleusine coracana subsp. coracana TaxID=191504 RepID=A0AAV5DER2_ELECO|nr:hypothetical protein QOZ80_3AG0238370 [Eleusine coracana subsp. coracana]GJN08693.1 hypothetical protein PR202_ga26644 [Eleusine coracana subsp. coracana]
MMAHVLIDELVQEAAAQQRALFILVPLLFFSLVLLPLPLLLRSLASSTRTRSRARRDSDDPLSEFPSPPRRLPVIGHLHLMGALPHISLAELAFRHGPEVMLLRLGSVPTVVVSSPRAAEAVLRTHDHIFASRPRTMVADIIMYGATDSCFAPYGDHFRKARKLVTLHLLSATKVRSQRPARVEEARLVLGRIREAAAANAPVDMSEVLHSFVNDLVCRFVSGKFSQEEGRNKLFRELTDINAALLGGFNAMEYFPILARLFELFSKVACAKAKAVRKRWDQLLDKLIDDHATRLMSRDRKDDAVTTEQGDTDFIDVLLSLQEEYGLTRDHMKAILIDMFEAGTDTSYVTLEFAMAHLMREPHLMAKLHDEVRRTVPKGQEMVTEDDLTNMTYLKSVIKETLRLHPPVPLLIPHFSRDACNIGGYTIPADTRVIVNARALGRHQSYWEIPNEFLPERFMDGGNANNVDFKGRDFHFLPFGSGRRMCPGIHSATVTTEIMLANLMYHFDWELPVGLKKEDVDMVEVFGITVQRRQKLVLVPKIA